MSAVPTTAMAMAMPTANITAPAPSQTASMHMPQDGRQTMAEMSSMAMTFVASIRTPLFWTWWRPDGAGAYAGTCLFLVAFALLTRVMFALKPVFEGAVWRGRRPRARAPTDLPSHDPEEALPLTPADPGGGGGGGKAAFLLPRSIRPVGRMVRKRWAGATLVSRLARASYEVVLAGFSYLLMLAVMTMNVGYFLSVLGGLFLGTFLLGNLAVDDADDSQWQHC